MYDGEDPLLVQQARPSARNAALVRRFKLVVGAGAVGLFVLDWILHQFLEPRAIQIIYLALAGISVVFIAWCIFSPFIRGLFRWADTKAESFVNPPGSNQEPPQAG